MRNDHGANRGGQRIVMTIERGTGGGRGRGSVGGRGRGGAVGAGVRGGRGGARSGAGVSGAAGTTRSRPPSKDALDAELNAYMLETPETAKSYLDQELEEYMRSRED